MKSNATSFQNINSISNIQFRAWAQFLNEHSLIRYALTTRVVLNVEALRELYVTADDTSDVNQKSFTFMIHERSITVTEHDINRILQFPTDNFAPDPTDEEISQFFQLIRLQQVDFSHGELYKYNLPRHWNFFFGTLLNVFLPRKRLGTDSITEPIRKIGFAVAHNREINFGRIIISMILTRMGPLDKRNILEHNVDCFFPRFLQLILNDFLTADEQGLFANAAQQPSEEMKSHFISGLIKKNRFPDIPTVLTPYLQTVGLPLTLPVPVAADELAGNIPFPNPQIDAVVDPILEPSVAILQDQEVVNPQLLTQIQEPNTINVTNVATFPQPSSSLNSQTIQSEGESAQEAPHKESDPTLSGLPHSKRSKTSSTSEVTTAQQQTVAPTPAMEFIDPDWEAIMAEVRRPVQFRWPAKLDLTVNLGNLDPLPPIGSSSTQPEITSLAPERDNSTLEVERQLRTEDSIVRSTPSTKDILSWIKCLHRHLRET